MTSSSEVETFAVSVQYSPDPDVQAFCECSVWNFNPRAAQGSPGDLIDAAVQYFGDDRCIDLGFTVH